MASGFEDAKNRRNWVEKLGETIPGFRGYQDRELRRDVDKLQREYFSGELDDVKRRSRDKARSFADAGEIEELDRFDRVDRRIEGLSQAIRFSDYGSTGLFDVVKIGDEELQKLYQYDLSVIEIIDRLTDDISAIPGPEQGDLSAALRQVIARLDRLDAKWAGRRQAISEVVRSSASRDDE